MSDILLAMTDILLRLVVSACGGIVGGIVGGMIYRLLHGGGNR